MLSSSTYRIHGLACWILIGLGTAHALGTLVDAFAPTFFAPSDLQVVACGGKVVLRGIAVHSTLAREAGGIAGTTDGVKDVINRIEVVRAPRGL